MRRGIWAMALLALATPTDAQPGGPEGVRVGDDAARARLRGRWVTTREGARDWAASSTRLSLEFKGDELMVVSDEGGKRDSVFAATLKVIEVRPDMGTGTTRLVLGHGERSRYEVAFDFVGDRLVLVGRLLNRPFEGFSLSGEYRRPDTPR